MPEKTVTLPQSVPAPTGKDAGPTLKTKNEKLSGNASPPHFARPTLFPQMISPQSWYTRVARPPTQGDPPQCGLM
ncbi:hypothetical protein CVU37_07530 [candidate division BRC1 bacterium HGW-BRC1-1]|nr:MAG: hypothetical protein CVU37_07530 [candidate division BRC1 bacterium HGW-BRC1-1]